jgi:HK97 family phage prohead protease
MIHKTNFKTKIADVDEKGRVVIAVNAFGNVDSDNDISVKGSFKKTLSENFSRVKWYLNHNQGQLLGVPIEGVETDDYLQMTAQLNMNKQMSRDIYEDYRLYAEHGKTLEHSIGVDPVKRDSKDARMVLEYKLWEFSTLTNWGANSNTPLLSIKSEKEAGAMIEFLEKMLQQGKHSEERQKAMENEISIIKKVLNGVEMVTCPGCGKSFDYNSQDEISLESQVIDSARMYASWIAEDKVRSEMNKLSPEIQLQVENIIQSKKSIDDIVSYVNCPHCWHRVSRASKTLEPPAGTQAVNKSDKTDVQSRKDSTFLTLGVIKK